MGMGLKDFGKASVASIIKACLNLAAGSDELAKAVGYTENAGSPVAAIVPDFVGQVIFDTVGLVFYKAVGNTANTQWTAMTIASFSQYATAASASPVALTTAQVSDSPDNVLQMTTNLGAGGTLNLPSAASVIAAMPGSGVGASIRLRIINSSVGNFAWTLAAGGDANITLTGTMTIAKDTYRDFVITITAATTITVQSVGTGTNS